MMNPRFTAHAIAAVVLILGPGPSPGALAQDRNLPATSGLVRQAHLIGGESRMSLQRYARTLNLAEADAARRFAATGIIRCGNLYGTVQLTGRNNLVTTAGHAIRHRGSCKPLNAQCEVRFPLSSNPARTYRIKAGSWKDGGCVDAGRSRTDWAVFELDAPVPNVSPYAIPGPGHYARAPRTVLMVASLAANFIQAEQLPQIADPPFDGWQAPNYNFQSCRIRDRDRYDDTNLHLDCDAGFGSSGSGLLTFRNGRYYLTAIQVGESHRRPSGSAYDPDDHFNTGVAVEGEFLAELHRRIDGGHPNATSVLIGQARVIEGESRMSLREFARTLNLTEAATATRFAATGVIRCGNAFSTAQLTGRNDLVTAAGHAVRYPDTCQPRSSQCEVRFPLSANPRQSYQIRLGSWRDGGCDPKRRLRNDWAVFELDAPVDSVSPYEVPEPGHYAGPPTTVLMAASLANNFIQPEPPTQTALPFDAWRVRFNYSFQTCRIRLRYLEIDVLTDCDAGGGSTGAALLTVRNDKYSVAAIHVGESSVRYNRAVAVEAEFLAELHRRMKGGR